jgi:serine/threonine-protein kinase
LRERARLAPRSERHPASDDSVIKEGNILNERYRLVRPLGQGSQAFVWVAEHLALGSHVAVKLIDPELAKQEDARERFRREATAAAKLRSAHVVQIIDHGIEGDQPFIVMELLEGEDLFQRLDRVGHLPLQQVSRIVTQVARALMRAHAEGIIHRDLKPENVFITNNEDDEVVKVLDFGVAKITTPQKAQMTKTGAGTLIGTPHYMSPEQVKGIGEIDHRSDLWSLAVIAYQAATGHLPFDSDGVGDLLIKISLHHPKTPSEVNPELPRAFDEWFERASEKDPAKRYQSARELAEALARSAGIEPRQSAQRQEGRVELDWGPDSFTNPGNRIADLLRAAAAPHPGERTGQTQRRSAPKAEEIEVVEGSMPPPPNEPPKPPPKPKAPRPPTKDKDVDAGAVPLWDLPKAGAKPADKTSQPPSSSGARAMASTVTGLSSSGTSIVPPPELDGSGKRRVLWFFAVAFALGAIALTVSVIRSQMITSESRMANPPDSVAPPAPPPPTTSAPQSQTSEPSSSTSATAVDPSVTKKPTNSAAPVKPTGAPGVPPLARTVKTKDGDVEIWVPLPDKEVPRR